MSRLDQLARLDGVAQAELVARGELTVNDLPDACQRRLQLFWSAEGEPIGSHFAAAPGQEGLLLGLAYELEQARPRAERWAPYSFVRLAGA